MNEFNEDEFVEEEIESDSQEDQDEKTDIIDPPPTVDDTKDEFEIERPFELEDISIHQIHLHFKYPEYEIPEIPEMNIGDDL